MDNSTISNMGVDELDFIPTAPLYASINGAGYAIIAYRKFGHNIGITRTGDAIILDGESPDLPVIRHDLVSVELCFNVSNLICAEHTDAFFPDDRALPVADFLNAYVEAGIPVHKLSDLR